MKPASLAPARSQSALYAGFSLLLANRAANAGRFFRGIDAGKQGYRFAISTPLG